MNDRSLHIVLCNDAELPHNLGQLAMAKPLKLDYRPTYPSRNIKLKLPDFVRDVFYLTPRVLDLLEIAGYIFAADRLISRGSTDSIEYHSWSRSFHFVIKVRDYHFWSQPTVKEKLSLALCFMTGDREYSFTFQPGHYTPPTGLFNSEQFTLNPRKNTSVVLFSGGLDSLTGVIQRLQQSNDTVCLVSHRSGQPETARTQDRLFRALRQRFPSRIKHYRFYCSLRGIRAIEETQRTRSFLYSSIAYAICSALSQNKFYLYENGVTAMNFPRRQDLMNARASRTSHPKTIALLQDLFAEIEVSQVLIKTPFMLTTKTEVMRKLFKSGMQDLITSTVSCSRTFQNIKQATHCGGCFQCVDRRFAAHGSRLDDIDDEGIYAVDFVQGEISEAETKTTLVDYVRQALYFAQSNVDRFYSEHLNELVNIVDYIPGMDEEKATMKVWELCRRHGQQIEGALKRMRNAYDKPFEKLPKNSLLGIIAEREYLKQPVQRLVESICNRLAKSIPIAFQKNPPKDENDFNDKVSALLMSYKDEFEREHPTIKFALAKAMPDHSYGDLFIESKYIRGSTSPSKASKGIAEDIIKYPVSVHILFIVYDPERNIPNDEEFCQAFKTTRRCTIYIIR